MLRLHLSLWIDLTNVVLTICMVLAHNAAESQSTKLHMGILETGEGIIRKKMELGQRAEASTLIDKEYDDDFERLQFSYALSALRHLHLTEGFLYSSDKKIIINDPVNREPILFAELAASMLATTERVPSSEPLQSILWLLWFYAYRLHILLMGSSCGKAVCSLKAQFIMSEAHRSIKECLKQFVVSNTGADGDVENKLEDINKERIPDEVARRAAVCENKVLLNNQLAFNERCGFPADYKKHVSFLGITHFDRLGQVEKIVVEYFGKQYWTDSYETLYRMYDTAMEPDVTLTGLATRLWHVQNGIAKILKGILLKFVESHLDSAPKPKEFVFNRIYMRNIRTPEETIISKLSEFCECVGKSPDSDKFVSMFEKRSSHEDFNGDFKKTIEDEKKHYPGCTEIDKISVYYRRLTDESKVVLSKDIRSLDRIDSFLDKVKSCFSEVNTSISQSFYSLPFAESFGILKEIENSLPSTQK